MKKRFFITSSLVLSMAMSAFAAESTSSANDSAATATELEVTQKNVHELSGEYSSDTAYFYAKVENNTAEGRYVGNGKLVCFSADDDILVSDDYVSSSPRSGLWLEPGEYAYVVRSIWEDALESADIAEVKFSLKSGDYGYQGQQIDCEAEFFYDPEEEYDNEIYVTFTNTLEEKTNNFYITAALLDEEGNILYVEDDQLYSTMLHPGSTVTQILSISSSMSEYFAENGIVPASVDAMVYYFED